MKTLVIFDLDETLVNNRSDHRVQEILTRLVNMKVTLAIASRNDQYIALARLREEHITKFFSVITADFRPKGFQVREILHKYALKGIHFDRVFFIDDAESNIQDVKKRVPQVECLHFGKDLKNLEEIVRIITTDQVS